MKNSIVLFTVFIILFFFVKTSISQTPDWLWAKRAGGTDNDNVTSIEVDASGNVYITGWYTSSDLTFGSTTLSNTGMYDIFLAKYDKDGNVLWAKCAGGTSIDYPYSVAVDASGCIYLTGLFQSSTITFGDTTLTNAGNSDIFFTKYDTSGNVLWAKVIGGSHDEGSNSLAINGSDDIYMTGYYRSPTITFGSTVLTNFGWEDIFIVKYDTAGNTIWAKSAGGIDGDKSNSVIADTFGNIYIAGYSYSSTLNFDTIVVTSTGTTDFLLAKYDTDGNALWVRIGGGMNDDEATSTGVDAEGNPYVCGWFWSTTINVDTVILSNADTNGYTCDLFLIKYDTAGNLQWAKSLGGTAGEKANSMVIDDSANIYLAGDFRSSTFNIGNTTLTNTGVCDVFLTMYNTDGDAIWAKSNGGTLFDSPSDIALDDSGNVFITGIFVSSTINFDATILTNPNYYYEIFLAKTGIVITEENELSNKQNISVFPNPANDKITIQSPPNSDIEIINITGQILEFLYSTDLINIINVANFSSGVYIIKIKTDKGVAIKKFIKQ